MPIGQVGGGFNNLTSQIQGILRTVCEDQKITKSTPVSNVKLGDNITYEVSV
jgi:hypothetical protein